MLITEYDPQDPRQPGERSSTIKTKLPEDRRQANSHAPGLGGRRSTWPTSTASKCAVPVQGVASGSFVFMDSESVRAVQRCSDETSWATRWATCGRTPTVEVTFHEATPIGIEVPPHGGAQGRPRPRQAVKGNTTSTREARKPCWRPAWQDQGPDAHRSRRGDQGQRPTSGQFQGPGQLDWSAPPAGTRAPLRSPDQEPTPAGRPCTSRSRGVERYLEALATTLALLRPTVSLHRARVLRPASR